MTLLRKALLAALGLAALAALWVWWSRPSRVDMAAYVPAVRTGSYVWTAPTGHQYADTPAPRLPASRLTDPGLV